jgi:hypothetical protein
VFVKKLIQVLIEIFWADQAGTDRSDGPSIHSEEGYGTTHADFYGKERPGQI